VFWCILLHSQDAAIGGKLPAFFVVNDFTAVQQWVTWKL
jgi:hypothetical protein